jgi:hypothetical protein
MRAQAACHKTRVRGKYGQVSKTDNGIPAPESLVAGIIVTITNSLKAYCSIDSCLLQAPP